MHTPAISGPVSVRTILALSCGGICALVIAAPLLASHSCHILAGSLYLFFSSACHQIPERCFNLSGHTLAVCHRCFGIYLGLFIGSLVAFEKFSVQRSPLLLRMWVVAAGTPLIFDTLLPFTGLWTNGSLSRFLTGLIFGAMLSSLLSQGIAESLSAFQRRRLSLHSLYIKGGIS